MVQGFEGPRVHVILFSLGPWTSGSLEDFLKSPDASMEGKVDGIGPKSFSQGFPYAWVPL
jgi:hypothetical protein